MTDAIDVQTAIIQHLLNMPGRWPVRTPNVSGPLAAKRYIIESSANRQVSDGVSRTTEVDREVMVRIEVPEGQGDTEANAQAQAIVAWFAKGTLIGGGMVEINEAPDPRPGFNADGLFIVPVAIRGRGYFE